MNLPTPTGLYREPVSVNIVDCLEHARASLDRGHTAAAQMYMRCARYWAVHEAPHQVRMIVEELDHLTAERKRRHPNAG